MLSKIQATAVSLGFLFTVTGCGSSGSGDDAVPLAPSSSTDSLEVRDSVAQDLIGDLPAGNITSYGAITVGDDAGMASDLVASFFKLDSSVSAEFLAGAFDSNQTLCSVNDIDDVDFEEISVGFIPSFNGVDKQPISAGESIVLSSEAGTFATIQTAGSFLLYTVPDTEMLPSGPVPAMLQVDIPGDDFPSYKAAMMPSVQGLENVSFGGAATISSTSKMTWTPSSEPGALVRIFPVLLEGFSPMTA